MAMFRVGQRVRFVRCYRHPECVGTEGTISRFGIWPKNSETIQGPRLRDCNVAVVSDELGGVTCHTDDIEPIQPEHNTVVSWESLNLPFDPRKVLEEES